MHVNGFILDDDFESVSQINSNVSSWIFEIPASVLICNVVLNIGSKTMKLLDTYLGPSQISVMELFAERSA